MTLLSLLADILFVGHSLVGPDLPPMLDATLRAMNEPGTVQAQMINGASLAHNWDHSVDGEGVDARAELPSGDTDVLILAEAGPLISHIEGSHTARNAARFAALAVQANPETRVYLHETWPSLLSGTETPPPGDPAGTLPWRTRITADLIVWEDLAVQASGATPVRLIPAGQAMGLLSDAIDQGQVPGLTSIREMFTDDIRPNGKGLYFLAMVHAASITGRNPEGVPARLLRAWDKREDIVTDDIAAALQRIAWAAVSAEHLRNPALLPLTDPPATATATVASEPDPQPQFAPITNPNLGLGLAAVNDWSVQQPFLDVMKTARPWVGHLPGQWGGWDHDRLAAEGVLDPQGWPKTIPAALTGLSTLILTDLAPEATSAAGRYDLTYQGSGTLIVEGRANITDATPGRITFDYTPGDGAVVITLTATDPADPIRAITVVRQDRATALAAGEIFNPDWITRIKGVKLIRLMDWMGATNATLADPKDRPRPDDYTWARQGVPIEVQIALANQLHANPWFSIPHTANDALVREWATLAHATLDPTLNAHVEFSNEVWNWQFAQAQWAEDQGKARWGRDQTSLQFYGFRAAQVMDIWRDTYGPDAPTRLTRIIATQTGWPGVEEQILDAPLVTAEGLPPPVTSFDAYAVTGYFSALLGSDPKLPLVKDWLTKSAAADPANPYALAFTLAAQELRDGALSGDRTDSLSSVLSEILPYHAAIAANRGLKLVMYEGGSHVAAHGAAVDDPQLTDFFTALNYSAEMGALYDGLLQGWSRLSPEPFNAFVDVARPIKWGSWGALRHLADDNPRWQALANGCTTC